MSLLVVGALHWDVVVDATRLPRLGETLRGSGVDYRLGGKGGNQAIAAARAGADVAFAGRVGSDAAGTTMALALENAGVDTGLLQQGPRASGMSAAISVDGGDYGAVIVSGENHAFDVQKLALPPDCRILLTQNEMARGLIPHLSEAARTTNAEFWLNLAPATGQDDAEIARLADVAIVNRVEAGDLLGNAGETEPLGLVGSLHNIASDCTWIVTLGGDGAAIKPKDGDPFLCPAAPVEVVSTHGAGDVFCGALAAARLAGAAWPSALEIAQSAAAAHVAQIR